MKAKLLKDKNQAITEAKDLINALQTIENTYMFSELHYADKDFCQQYVGLHIRQAIEQAADLVVILNGLSNEEVGAYQKVSKFRLLPSFEMFGESR